MPAETVTESARIRGLIALGVLLISALALRLGAFSLSVIDWDESVYFLMARSIHLGEWPYESVWDHKPVGIYLVFAVAQAVLGSSVIAIRAAAVIAVAVTAFLMRSLVLALTDRAELPASSAALAYLVLTTAGGGLASNTELFFVPLVCSAFLLQIRTTDRSERENLKADLGSGLAMGLALQIKYIVLPESTVLLLFILVRQAGGLRGSGGVGGRFVSSWRGPALYCLGLIGPTLAVMAVFLVAGHWDSWYSANIVANFVHVGGGGMTASALVQRNMLMARRALAIWLGSSIALFQALGLLKRDRQRAAKILLVVGWWWASLIGANATGHGYAHYFLSTLAPGCVLTTVLIHDLVACAPLKYERPMRSQLRELAILALVLGPLMLPGIAAARGSYYSVKYWSSDSSVDPYRDTTAVVGRFLRREMADDDTLFVINSEPILYHLADSPWPTKFLFPLFLLHPHFSEVAALDPQQELLRVMSDRPTYLVRGPVQPWVSQTLWRDLTRLIDKDYDKAMTIGEVEVLVLKNRVVVPNG